MVPPRDPDSGQIFLARREKHVGVGIADFQIFRCV